MLVSAGVLTVEAECPGEPGIPCGNGDVNGDGARDIGDAIFLLSHLFAEGPAPESIPCDCPPTEGCFPATCQTSCYAIDCNVLLDCDNPSCPGQDGFYGAGCTREGRFVDNEDGTLMDTYTGLMWTKAAAPNRMTWQEALQYCENLVLGEEDYDDWRLPNVSELRSLCRFDVVWPASAFGPEFVLPQGDPNALTDWSYWSSTSFVFYQFMPEYANRAWCVNYSGGSAALCTGNAVKTYGGGRVLAVRGGR